jgi:hypothetical protein
MISEGSRIQGFKGSSDPPQNRRIKNAKEIQRVEKYGLTSQIRRSVVSIPSNTCPVK